MRRCEGCDYELYIAILFQDVENLYYATSTQFEYDDKKHFFILMVDNNGKIVIGK